MEPVSKKVLILGWLLSLAPSGLLIMSGVMKLMKPPEVVEGFAHLGWDVKLALALAIVEIACTVIYLIPQTAVLGAILLTGYMGGAIATHVRLEEAFYTQAGIGVVLWLALYLREPRLRSLIPFRS